MKYEEHEMKTLEEAKIGDLILCFLVKRVSAQHNVYEPDYNTLLDVGIYLGKRNNSNFIAIWQGLSEQFEHHSYRNDMNPLYDGFRFLNQQE